MLFKRCITPNLYKVENVLKKKKNMPQILFNFR